ncbi:hypothetical protein A0J57_04055 [Sphingobium sp. 22B]|uniref:aromatic ring-hydroxylating oxygenase subunit alpha n=1 Tax=unclassified Sphingobium TaxID=2611147 RepID=UPI0007861CF3|nr:MULTISPECIES: aromatic ring-hydroxylating dioxygenase subunit alpha [unclassified Sphingobium]KXU33822.1 hypothetical protein AXW74_00605 [Sphingobium sp. AM]KYC33766.1 hypothetical protein A0J57_04055 [Sphingobium sp. 22B]OAP33504.1 hypothetical protein A8O16_03275 [Sphingobium sp. 20006FA]
MSEDYDIEKGYIVYPKTKNGDIAAKSPKTLVHKGIVPTERYFSREEADMEWDRLFQKVWLFAGLTQDLSKVGDYFKFDVGRESIVVVRSSEDNIQAFYNVCPHRGNFLVYDDYGSIKDGASLYCKFHGWRFNLDGSVRSVKDRHTFPPENLCGMNGLRELRCEVWNALVFVSFDDDVEPLHQALGVVPEHLANYDFTRSRVYREVQDVVDANWKTAMEAFLEFYHSDDTHPEVIPLSATLRTQYDLYDKGVSRMFIRFGYSGDRSRNPDDVPEILKGMITLYGGDNADYLGIKGGDYRRAFCDTLRKWAARNGHSDLFDRLSDDQVTDDWNYSIFPHVTLNVFSYGVHIQSWLPCPDDPEKHVYRSICLLLPLADPDQVIADPTSMTVAQEKGWTGEVRPPRIKPKSMADWGSVLLQDVERLPYIQRGLRSRSHVGNRLSASECRINHYLDEIDRYLGRK